MFDALKALLTGGEKPEEAAPAEGPERLQVAACALLLELAHADQEFSPEERRHIEQAVTHYFDLGEENARKLMAVADEARREAIDLHQFTSLITRHYDEGQRMVLAEIMWRVVLADGKLSDHEAMLARQLANLLELRPGYLSEARRRAQGGPPESTRGKR